MSIVGLKQHTISIDSVHELGLNLNEYYKSADARNAVTWSCSVPDLGAADKVTVCKQLDREEIIVRKDRASMLGKMAQLALHTDAGDKEDLSSRKPGVLSISDRNLLSFYGAKMNALAHAKFIIHAAAAPAPAAAPAAAPLPAAVFESDDKDASINALIKRGVSFKIKNITEEPASVDEDASIDGPIINLSSFNGEDKSTLYIADWTMKVPNLDTLDVDGLGKHYCKYGRSEHEAISERDNLLRSLACTYIQRSVQPGSPLGARTVELLPGSYKTFKALEALSDGFRYAQYIVLGKSLSKAPPLDKTFLKYQQRELIEYCVKWHDVPHLVHFTQVSNVRSILEHGLLSREEMDSRNINAAINDDKRYDGVKNGTSLSISFPNNLCFFSMRKNAEKNGLNLTDWAVLLIDRSVLWKKDCLFNYFNAADNAMSSQSCDDRRTFLAYEAMFENVAGPNSREAQKLKASDPTNVQAEVLVCDDIEPEYIKGIIFNSEERRGEHAITIKNIPLSYEKWGVFGQRAKRQ